MHAEEEAQRYKVGNYILETKRVVESHNEWEDGIRQSEMGQDDELEIHFDSQDEDECEDLFSGIWSPELAKRRKKNKNLRRQ